MAMESTRGANKNEDEIRFGSRVDFIRWMFGWVFGFCRHLYIDLWGVNGSFLHKYQRLVQISGRV